MGKPLAFSHGDESAVPFLGAGAQGHSLYDKVFILHFQFDEHLYIDTYAILSLVHKQQNSVYGFRGKSFPRVKALTYQTFGVPIDDVGLEPTSRLPRLN